MLPNMGRQNCHNTCDGLPTVRSLFIAKILLYNDYKWENSVNAATSIEPKHQKVKKIFGIYAIRKLHGGHSASPLPQGGRL